MSPKKDKAKNPEYLCKCRPVCHNRRRLWKGEVQQTSAELLLERKPVPECFRRWPSKMYPNGPCPLFHRTKQLTINERNAFRVPNVVRICQAPIDDTANTPNLQHVEMAKKLGAFNAVRVRDCPFCACDGCCACVRGYTAHDAQSARARRDDMLVFDERVARDRPSMRMKIMYDKP